MSGEKLIISPRYRQVVVDGKPLELSRKEFDLLHCLATYPGQGFSREQIYSHIWDDEPTVAVDGAVKSLIKKLRKKLATVNKDYSQNMRGVGYKFVSINTSQQNSILFREILLTGLFCRNMRDSPHKAPSTPLLVPTLSPSNGSIKKYRRIYEEA